MSCLLVPFAEAIAVSVVKKVWLKRNSKEVVDTAREEKLLFVKNSLETLEKVLYGGSLLLLVDHICNKEVILNFKDVPAMLGEMARVGVPMALVATAVWGVSTACAWALRKRRASLAKA